MIPQGIQAFFEAPSFEGAVILAQDELTEYGADDCRFTLIRTKSGENVLYCFKQESGDWKEQFHTSGAVPQTSHGVQMHIALSGVEWITDERFGTPRLYIGQEDKEGEYWEWTITYELQNGKWMLRRIYSYIGYDSMLIQDGSISYYREIESNRIAGTAKGVFQRDIRYVNLSPGQADRRPGASRIG